MGYLQADGNSSDNFRQSAIQGLCSIKARGVGVVVRACAQDEVFEDSRVIKDFDEFKKISDVIVANRLSDELRIRIRYIRGFVQQGCPGQVCPGCFCVLICAV